MQILVKAFFGICRLIYEYSLSRVRKKKKEVKKESKERKRKQTWSK